MNIYCFSDYHNQERLLPEMRKQATKADLVISGGDHTIFEFDQDKILREFNSWNKKTLLLHGNHEEASTVKRATKKYDNLSFTHEEEHVINGVRILTWGGGGFTLTDRELDKKIKEWKKSEHKELPTILVTHAPPYNTALDDIHGRHVGNKTIRKAIEELQPMYAISGHIHEAEGATQTIGTTNCYNIGPKGKIIKM